MAISLHDSIIDPQLQIKAFQTAGEPKTLLNIDCGHFDIGENEHFEQNISTQLEFLAKYL